MIKFPSKTMEYLVVRRCADYLRLPRFIFLAMSHSSELRGVRFPGPFVPPINWRDLRYFLFFLIVKRISKIRYLSPICRNFSGLFDSKLDKMIRIKLACLAINILIFSSVAGLILLLPLTHLLTDRSVTPTFRAKAHCQCGPYKSCPATIISFGVILRLAYLEVSAPAVVLVLPAVPPLRFQLFLLPQ